MGTRETTIKLTVADNFSQNLRAFADQLDNSERSTEGLKDGLERTENKTKSFSQETKQSTNVMTELNSAISLARQAYGVLQGAIEATVGATVEYAAQVRTLSRTIGASAEETSKLIQAADDVGVSVESLSSAMEAAIRKGVRPTIEGLGQLSEEYLAIQDPIERSKFLMDNFGRSGNDLSALMEKGATGIKELGDNAEETGLVMSQQGVDAARRYEIAIDDLTDTVHGLQVEMGQVAIPILTDFIDKTLENTRVHSALDLAYKEGVITLEKKDALYRTHVLSIMSTKDVTEELNKEIAAYKDKQDGAVHALTNWRDESSRGIASNKNLYSSVKDLNTALMDEYRTLSVLDIGQSYVDLTDKQSPLIEQQKKLTKELENYKIANGSVIPPSKDLAKAQQELADIQFNLMTGSERYQLELMRVAKAQGDFSDAVKKGKGDSESYAITQFSQNISLQEQAKALEDSKRKMGEVNDKIKELSGGGIANYTESIKKTDAELQKVNEQIRKNAEEHDKATKKIVLNMLEQKLATSSFKDSSGAVLLELSKQWGLIDEKTYLYSKSLDRIATTSKNTGDVIDGVNALNVTTNESLKRTMDDVYDAHEKYYDFAKGEYSQALSGLMEKYGGVKKSVRDITEEIHAIPKETNIYINTFHRNYIENYAYSTSPDAGKTTTSDGGTQIVEYGGKQDSGGYGERGKTYFIGRGAQPEMFVPKSDGMFIPNIDKKMGGGSGGASVTINVAGSVISEGELIRNVVNGLRRENIINNGNALSV